MTNLKKISLDYYMAGVIFIAIALFVCLIIILVYIFIYYNVITTNEITIEQYIDSTPLTKIEKDKADLLINYQPAESLINKQTVTNPFRIFSEETKE